MSAVKSQSDKINAQSEKDKEQLGLINTQAAQMKDQSERIAFLESEMTIIKEQLIR